MRKLIQLDPQKAPLHPMLGVTKRMVIKRATEPFTQDELMEFIHNISFFLGESRFSLIDIGDAREVLSNYSFESTLFRNFSDDFWIQNSLTTGKDKDSIKINNFVQLVNLNTGSLFNEKLPEDTTMVDITGMKPYQPIEFLPGILYLMRLDSFLGVDLNWILLLTSEGNDRLEASQMPMDQVNSVRMMNHTLSDYKFQKDLTIRDYNYKAALLENLINSHGALHYYIPKKESRSQSVYAFTVDGEDADHKWFYQKVFEMGFEIGKSENKTGNEYFTIANFINHSKEQIELFVDKLDELLK